MTVSDDNKGDAGKPAPETPQQKSARLKALRLENDRLVAARAARANQKARVRREILGK